MPEIKTLLIRDLDDSFQIRANGTNSEKVQQYCEMFREYHGWGSFPPLTVVSITDDDEFPPGLYIADGIHRYQAALLANVGIQEVKCEVWEGKRDLLYAKSLEVNAFQGLSMSREDLKAARERIIKDLWPTRKFTPKALAEICHCSDDTIRNDIKRLEKAGFVPVIESVIGADGKERPTQYQRQNSTSEYSEVQNATPAIPHEYCAAGCGTPIWDDIKEAKDCAYVQWDGKWFCSEECAQAYLAKQQEPQEPPDEDNDEYEDEEPVYVTCPKCGKRELEKNLHRAGWIHEKEEGHYGKDLWYCSEECRDWRKGLRDESWKTEEPPAREPAPSSSQASGAEPEQEEPEEFAFTDVDEETLPVCTEEKPEATKCRLRVIYDVESEITDPAEVLRQLGLHSPFTFTSSYIPSIRITLAGLYENINQSLNNNININPATFTEFYICCKGKKGPVKVFISRNKYNEWKNQFGPSFDLDANLTECVRYYNELTGSEMLSAGGVYSKVYAWLLKNWKAQKKEESKPKKNAYKDAGLRFDPSDY